MNNKFILYLTGRSLINLELFKTKFLAIIYSFIILNLIFFLYVNLQKVINSIHIDKVIFHLMDFYLGHTFIDFDLFHVRIIIYKFDRWSYSQKIMIVLFVLPAFENIRILLHLHCFDNINGLPLRCTYVTAFI